MLSAVAQPLLGTSYSNKNPNKRSEFAPAGRPSRNRQALSQALAIIEVTGASHDQIVAAANRARSSGEPFEKDGYLWVGRLGLRFTEDGKLEEVSL